MPISSVTISENGYVIYCSNSICPFLCSKRKVYTLHSRYNTANPRYFRSFHWFYLHMLRSSEVNIDQFFCAWCMNSIPNYFKLRALEEGKYSQVTVVLHLCTWIYFVRWNHLLQYVSPESIWSINNFWQ